MKKLISAALSLAMVSSVMTMGYTARAVETTTSPTQISIKSGQRMTYIAEEGDKYLVRLYTGESKEYTEGATGYVPKADCNTSYFNYGRPWTDPYKSILNGAKYIASGYINTQYTMYFQKFNVLQESGSQRYKHEYMTYIKGAVEESAHLYNGYTNAGILDDHHLFYIPVFKDMPNDVPNVNTSTVAIDLINAGFPVSYVDKLAALKAEHPNWEFVAKQTYVTFLDAMAGEKTNNSSAELEKYLDPRNWLDAKSIFQFESIKQSDSSQTAAGVEGILKGTWMYQSKITYLDTQGNTKTVSNASSYSDGMLKTANDSGLSAYYIAAKIRQENGGTTNKATAVCGTKAPFQGIYNYYNIGAYATASDGLAWGAGFLKAKVDTTLYSQSDIQPTTTTTQPTTVSYKPAKVTLSSLTALSKHRIKVSWKKVSTSATGYQIYWAKDKSFKKIIAKTTVKGKSTVSYTGKGFTKGKKYYVKVRAYKTVNGKKYYGPWSNIKAKTSK